MINDIPGRFQKTSISHDHCSTIISPDSGIDMHLKKMYPAFAERIEQVNIGTFVEDTCACFANLDRTPGIVITHPLNDVADFELVFGALKHLVVDGCEFILVIIGTGPAEEQIRTLLDSLGLSQITSIISDIRPIRSLFSGADIFVQPQPANSFNSLLLEAMGVGMVVAGCKGGIDELLIENQTALIFDHTDQLSIYAVLRRFLDQRQLARQLAGRAQDYLRENHTVSKMVSAMLEIYRNAVEWMKR